MSEIKPDNAKVVLLRPEGDLLLLRRSIHEDTRVGEWDFVGGTIEPEETPSDTAVREGLDEAGIHLDPNTMRHLGTWDKTRYNAGTRNTWFFAAVVLDPVVTRSIEHDMDMWVPRREFLQYGRDKIPRKYVEAVMTYGHILDDLLAEVVSITPLYLETA